MKLPTTIDDLITGSLREKLAAKQMEDLLPFWQMSAAERSGLLSVLNEIRPDAAIEIGTAQGGSLAAIAGFAQWVFSLDIDPDCEARLKRRFSNVTFFSGPSQVSIGASIEALENAGRDLQFVLIDGDHSREGVKRDIELVLRYHPRRPMVILMHDSFNPFCRFGMRDAEWGANPHVRAVELDFVPGSTFQADGQLPEMWGGLGVALLLPEVRSGPVVVGERNRVLFERMVPCSVHAPYFRMTGSDGGNDNSSTKMSLYSIFSEFTESELDGYLRGIRVPGLAEEPDGFVEIRSRVGEHCKVWRQRGKRIAIYGIGAHTRALLGLMPELAELVTVFIDRRGGGSFLGRACVTPNEFSIEMADVVVYSSRAFEHEMFADFAHHPLEHVLLYN